MDNFFKKGLTWTDQDVNDLIGDSSFFYNYTTLGFLSKKTPKKYNHILQELPRIYNQLWTKVGVHLDEEVDLINCRNSINNAFSFITKYDSVCLGSTTKLIRSLHIIRNDSRGTDMSFSDPELPFSIFVSIPKSDEVFYIERLVESIIHESLHLQLTLIEKKENLYSDKESKTYSPWKNEPRNSVGILHAVYVFSKLKDFWYKVRNIIPNDFNISRISNITAELERINKNDIRNFYTERGNQLLECCLNSLDERSQNTISIA